MIDAINAAVPYTKTNVAGLTRGGLCIHFPWKQELFDSTNYVKLSFKATNWYAFLSKFVTSTGGGGGGNAVAISGTVTWPGHTLSANCYAYMDTIDANLNIYPVLQTQVNQTNGSFAFSFTLEGGSLNVFFDAWDDINGNGEYNVGNGWGFYDCNGSGNWDTGDALTIQPGNNYTGINISLSEITGKEGVKPLNLGK